MSLITNFGTRRPTLPRRYVRARRRRRADVGPPLFDLLPDEIVLRVAEATASVGDVARLGCTCRRLAVISKDDNLWRHLYGVCYRDPIVRAPSALGKDWRWLCRVRSLPGIPATANDGKWTFWGQQKQGRADGVGIGMRTRTRKAAPPTGSDVSLRDGDTKADLTLVEAYEGEWASGRQCGRGLWAAYDARTGRVTDMYDGQWADDMFQGIGAYISIDADWSYEGSWRGNQKHGYGVEITRDSTAGTEITSIHKGNWKDDAPHGRGAYISSDGWRCEGTWGHGLMNGFGVSVDAAGDVYRGEWKDDTPEGLGTYISHQGWRIQGSWVQGSAHGNVTTTYVDGSQWTGLVERRVCADGSIEMVGIDVSIVSHGDQNGGVGCGCRACRWPMRFSLTQEDDK